MSVLSELRAFFTGRLSYYEGCEKAHDDDTSEASRARVKASICMAREIIEKIEKAESDWPEDRSERLGVLPLEYEDGSELFAVAVHGSPPDHDDYGRPASLTLCHRKPWPADPELMPADGDARQQVMSHYTRDDIVKKARLEAALQWQKQRDEWRMIALALTKSVLDKGGA